MAGRDRGRDLGLACVEGMNVVEPVHETKLQAPWWRTVGHAFGVIEPHQARGPFVRWPRVADIALAVAVFLGSVVTVSVSALDDGADFTMSAVTDLEPGAFALLAVAASALVVRRRHAAAVAAVAIAVTVVWSVAGYGDGHDVAAVVASYGVGRYVDQGRGIAIVAAVSAVSFLGTVIDESQRVDVAPALVLAWVPWYLGRRIRIRREYLTLLQERADRLEADRLMAARRAAADERSRIARELHDVVAHQVSMMTVQAGAAKTVARDDVDVAIEAMGDVERAGRQTLGELRHLLGVLRPDAADPDDLGPQPGLGNIDSLVADLAQTGAEVTLDVEVPQVDLSAAVELSAFRIVQESLTNVMKHAGPRPIVGVAVTVDDGELVIDVENSTATSAQNLPASGFGIAGMEERVALLGGTLMAGPAGPDGFRVHARIPVEGRSG